jgi:sulfur carrier protein ThiS
MTATIIFRSKEYIMNHGMTLRKALLKLDIQPDSVLASRDSELITDDEILQADDVVKLIPVISGGTSIYTY